MYLMALCTKLLVTIIVIISLKYFTVNCFRCDRRPYASTTQSSASDGRFQLSVQGVEDGYIPEQLYTVQISETDGKSTFTGFMISAEGDLRQDPSNPRRIISLSPGQVRPQNSITTKFSDRCLYSVEHTMLAPKSSIEVYWQAPGTNNGCVTLRAMVIENEDVWYEDGSPLTQKICEDLRQPDDISPVFNYNCRVCDEAKYEVSFTGIWSRNTHPRLYPENDWVPHYSDLVGASHAVEYILWSPGSMATDGFKELAEYANSSKLEAEIREKIGDGVRTLIKGKGHGYRKMNSPTYSFFRTDNTNHLFTVAIAIYPSPDWFLGVNRFELCQEDNTWLQERELDLYPWDAGTDSGVSYESVNIATFPQDAISRVQLSSYDKNSPFYEMDAKDLHPFGKLYLKLIRTYERECEEQTTEAATATNSDETTEADGNDNEPSEPEEPSRYRNSELSTGRRGGEAPIVTDPDSSEDCPMSQWQEWSPCDGPCMNGKVIGYKWRERYHLVDGIPVEKYDPNADPSTLKEVPTFCKNHYEDFDKSDCEDDCTEELEEEVNVERRVMAPVAPGNKWSANKRHLDTKQH